MVLLQRFLPALSATVALVAAVALTATSLADDAHTGPHATVSTAALVPVAHHHPLTPSARSIAAQALHSGHRLHRVTTSPTASSIVGAVTATALVQQSAPVSTSPSPLPATRKGEPSGTSLLAAPHVPGQAGNLPASCPQGCAPTGAGGSGGTVLAAGASTTSPDGPTGTVVATVVDSSTAALTADTLVVTAGDPTIPVSTTAGDPPPPGEDPINWGPGYPDFDNSYVVP